MYKRQIWGNDGPGINLACSSRKDEWKLVYYYETGTPRPGLTGNPVTRTLSGGSPFSTMISRVQGSVTVSYTHLDVYKRQFYNFVAIAYGAVICLGFISVPVSVLRGIIK